MTYNSREYARLRNPVLAISLIAWALILLRPGASSCCQARETATSLAALFAGSPVTSLAGDWMLMLVAMMAPMLIPPIYQIWINSLARRRVRSSGLFVAGYGAVWMVAGGVLIAAELTVKWLVAGSYIPAAAVAVIVLVWQASPLKQRCLNRCHGHHPLPAFGLAADLGAARMGLEHGLWCVFSCWAAMWFPMLLPQGHLVAMMAVSVLMYCERLDHPRTPSWRWRGFGTALRYVKLRLGGAQAGRVPIALGAQT